MPMYIKLDGIDGESKAATKDTPSKTKVFSFADDLEAKGFNPQPEPPAEEQQMVVEDLDIFGFNPQPEPPADVDSGFADMMVF